MSTTNHLDIPAPAAPAQTQMPESDLSVDYSAFSAFLGRSQFIDCSMTEKSFQAIIAAEGLEPAKALMNAMYKLRPDLLEHRRKFQSPVVGARIPKGDGTFHNLNTWERYAAYHKLPKDFQGVGVVGSATEAVITF